MSPTKTRSSIWRPRGRALRTNRRLGQQRRRDRIRRVPRDSLRCLSSGDRDEPDGPGPRCSLGPEALQGAGLGGPDQYVFDLGSRQFSPGHPVHRQQERRASALRVPPGRAADRRRHPHHDSCPAGRRHPHLRPRGQLLRPPDPRDPPVLSADEVAAGIEACAEKPKQEVNYGRSGRILEIVYALAPGFYRRLAHRAFVRGTMSKAKAESTSGNVLASGEPHAISGHWRASRRGALARALTAAAVGSIAGLAGAKASTRD